MSATEGRRRSQSTSTTFMRIMAIMRAKHTLATVLPSLGRAEVSATTKGERRPELWASAAASPRKASAKLEPAFWAMTSWALRERLPRTDEPRVGRAPK